MREPTSITPLSARRFRLHNVAFRLGILLLFVGVLVAIRWAKAAIWPLEGRPPENLWDELLVFGSITWAMIIPWAVADLSGWSIYRRRTRATHLPPGPAIEAPVCFRIVARGDQPDVAASTAASILDTMRRRPLFPFTVEVVTDLPVPALPADDRVSNLVVPVGYATSKGATHKARALHYALETSEVDDRTWIVHLDEETHVTEGMVTGIRDHIAAEDGRPRPAIGQGLVLYHRGLETNTVMTLADSVRVADDMGRFHLQYRLHRMLFGMHGSYVAVRTDVERRVGWDLPPEACITEDTTWALLQTADGARFEWIDGYAVEQSPQTPLDFLRQRRRWFVGMWWGALRAPVRLRHRVPLIVSMIVWSVGWMALLYAVIRIFSGVIVPEPIAWLGDVVFATYVTNYTLGGWVSLVDKGVGILDRLRYLTLQIVLVPVFTFLEAGAVVYALARPETGFHVVRKTLPGRHLRPVPPAVPTAAQRAAGALLRARRPDIAPAEEPAEETGEPPAIEGRAG